MVDYLASWDGTAWSGLGGSSGTGTGGGYLFPWVFALAVQTAGLFGGSVSRESVVVADHYIGEGYAIKTVAAEKAMEVFARKEGIFLDNVYTGKAASALLDWLEKGALSGQSVLFLHTGGQAELFAKE